MYAIKNIKILLFIILILGLILRIYFAFTLPMISDEREVLEIAKNVSFDFRTPLAWLAKDASLGEHVMISVYGIKLGVFLFGENNFGIRLFSSLLFSIFSLVLLYCLVIKTLDEKAALISLCLLSFNQYHIVHSAIATQHIVRQLVVIIALLIFNKILKSPERKRFIYLGLICGLGYYTQPVFLLLPIIFYVYLAFKFGFVNFSRNKDVYISILIMTSIISIDIYLNKISGIWHYAFSPKSYQDFRLSWIGFNFFLLEPINLIRGIDWRLLISWEHPIIRWYSGLIIVIGAVYSIRYLKNKFVFLQLLIFVLAIGIVSFLPHGEFWWSNLAFIPGIILGSIMMKDLLKSSILGKILVITFLLFITFKAFTMDINVNIPPYKNAPFTDYDLDLMRWYIKNNRINEAVKEGELALKICPNLVKAYDLLGVCALKSGEFEGAYNYWIKALEIEPYFLSSIINLEEIVSFKEEILFLKKGIDNILGENYHDAIGNIKEYLSLRPDSALGNFYLGICLYKRGVYNQAKGGFEEVIQNNPKFVMAYIMIGRILLDKNKLEEALINFVKAVKINKDFTESYYWLAFGLQLQDDYLNAAHVYNKVLRMAPIYAKAYLRLSDIYIDRNEFRDAGKALKQAKKLNSLESGSYFFDFATCPDLYRYSCLPKNVAEEIYFRDIKTRNEL